MQKGILVFAASFISLSIFSHDARADRIQDFVYQSTGDTETDERSGHTYTQSGNEEIAAFWACTDNELIFSTVILDPQAKRKLTSTSNENPRVQYRFDDGAPIGPENDWTYLSETGSLLPPTNRMTEITKYALSATSLHIKIWNHEEKSVGTWTLSMMGSTRAIGKPPCSDWDNLSP